MTFNEVQAIAKTLPIGYYTKRGIQVSVDKKQDCSSYDMVNDNIVISYLQVQAALDQMPHADEVAVRSILYHEVSHALLTPKKLSVDDIMNIFEDERIETLLKDYYMNIDFENTKYAINGFERGKTLPKPTNKREAFYYAVRFRKTTPEINKKINNIILEYANFHRYYNYPAILDEYQRKVRGLYYEITKQYKENTLEQAKQPHTNTDTNEQGGMGIPAELLAEMQEKALEAMKKVTTFFDNPAFEKEIEMIISNFNKKNSGGSGLRSYSGIINPRLCGNNDYKFFERSSTVNGTNSFGTFHLNLFIDNSGSFINNQNIVNSMLKALISIEKRNKNFSFDFVTMNNRVVKHSKNDRVLRCGGGNALPSCLKKVINSLQLPNTYNYNIVLFDGDACSFGLQTETHKNSNFRFFDRNNCILISDKQNQYLIDTYIKTAKTIITKDYTDNLIKYVKMAIANAFR